MAFNIAIAGKGGVGKTTLTGMLVTYMAGKGKGPVLAVDADSNANLNEVLGLEEPITIGHVKEEINHATMDGQPLPAGITKADFLKLRLNQAIVEGKGFDLLVMGRGQGEGCYCYVNGMLKAQVDDLSKNYDYVIMDNEAGMEHISRGTMGRMDMLLLVSDSSRRGIQAVARIRDLAEELGLKIPVIKLIVNRAPGGELNAGTAEEIKRLGLDLAGVIPMDTDVFEFDAYGKPLVELPEDNPAKAKIISALDSLGIE
ncbi:ATP-binding protein [Eubacterium sp.]|uniref:ATP-binding protein n=1 Tax=Eubacterium sp. TaxID=142586 RepID=UPI002FC865EF